MAFIDELIGQGGLPYGMEIETPKAHDEINSLLEWDDSKMGMSEEDLMNIVMGTVGGGGGAGKGISKLILALKGKIKGGKMIPSQPIRKGIVGGPKSSDFTKEGMLGKDFLKKQYSDMLKTGEIDDILKSNQVAKQEIKDAGGTAVSIPLLALISTLNKTKNWPGKLAEMFSPDPVEEYPVEGNLKDMIKYYDILENREKTKDSTII